MREEVKRAARERMKGFCRVCPSCDGRACAGEVPGMGGAGSGSSFMRNVDYLASQKLVMRTIHHVSTPETEVRLFDRSLDLPVITAPIGGIVYNMSSIVSESDYLYAIIEGAKMAGSLASSGDGELEEIFEAACTHIKAAGGAAIPFIKPWGEETLGSRIAQIEERGVPAFGMDIDAAGLVTLGKLGKAVYPKGVEELERVAASTSIPFIIKGVMSVDEARAAVDTGASGIVVSNHGGRVLDSAQASAEVLPEIAEAVGDSCTLLVDGGVRSGTDLFKMIALGADAVLVGRPFAIAAIGGGAEAVREEFERLRTELIHSMIMTGCPSIEAISRRSLFKTSPPAS